MTLTMTRPMNWNISATLDGTNLKIVDAGGTKTVDLGSLNNPGTDNQTLTWDTPTRKLAIIRGNGVYNT